jgi:hypothetical protein
MELHVGRNWCVGVVNSAGFVRFMTVLWCGLGTMKWFQDVFLRETRVPPKRILIPKYHRYLLGERTIQPHCNLKTNSMTLQ